MDIVLHIIWVVIVCSTMRRERCQVQKIFGTVKIIYIHIRGVFMFIKQPFDEFLGFEYNKVDDNNLQLRLPIQDLFVNSAGVVHGGVISSLCDVAMSNLIPANENGIQRALTVDLNVSFLKPAIGTYLIAKAQIEKQGRTLIHTECSIFNDKQELVAKSKAILFRKP
jgi:uncharacterized protein (TIGR00369 family)